MFFYRADPKGLKDIARDEVVIINVPGPQIIVHPNGEIRQICRLIPKLHEPFVIGFSCLLLDHGCHRELRDVQTRLICRLHEAILHLFADDVLPKRRNEMFSAAGNHQAIWVDRNDSFPA